MRFCSLGQGGFARGDVGFLLLDGLVGRLAVGEFGLKFFQVAPGSGDGFLKLRRLFRERPQPRDFALQLLRGDGGLLQFRTGLFELVLELLEFRAGRIALLERLAFFPLGRFAGGVFGVRRLLRLGERLELGLRLGGLLFLEGGNLLGEGGILELELLRRRLRGFRLLGEIGEFLGQALDLGLRGLAAVDEFLVLGFGGLERLRGRHSFLLELLAGGALGVDRLPGFGERRLVGFLDGGLLLLRGRQFVAHRAHFRLELLQRGLGIAGAALRLLQLFLHAGDVDLRALALVRQGGDLGLRFLEVLVERLEFSLQGLAGEALGLGGLASEGDRL